MSSRVLRRLREEKEAEERENGEGSSSEEEEEDDATRGGGGNKAFMMMLEEESSSEEEEDEEGSSPSEEEGGGSEDEGEDDGKASVPPPPPAPATATATARSKAKNKRRSKDEGSDEEEDLDAILSDMNIHGGGGGDPNGPTAGVASDDPPPRRTATLRSLLLSKKHGFDVQDLDLDNAVRSLLGGAGAGAGVDDIMGAGDGGGAPQQRGGRRGAGGGGGNRRGRRTLAKRYLFGKPKAEWGKPPSYVGGGMGCRELTAEAIAEERNSWSAPWPYDAAEEGERGEDGDDDEDDNDNNGDDSPSIPPSDRRWHTLTMSDTYQEQNYVYRELLSSVGASQLHDPNALAMFVADRPYFADALLQLAMVLYHVGDRGKGGDLLRRCIFVYEAALPSNVLPNPNDGGGDDDSDDDVDKNGAEILIDADRHPNGGLFAALFRVMQTSGMSGCHANALATGRFLLSLDPLRDPTGCLPILDYYALMAGRRARRTSGGASRGAEDGAEYGAKFIVDLVDSKMVAVHHKDPLTDRHHRCDLADMPNWAFSYAMALRRLSLSDEEEGGDSTEEGKGRGYEERADDALVEALAKFPAALPKLLAMNEVNARDRSFRADWPTILPYFEADANEAAGASDTLEDRVARASGEHLVRIFVQRHHKLWKEDRVLRWLFKCAERVANQHRQQSADGNANEKEETERTPPPENAPDVDAAVPVAPPTPACSPALARYAQCDPSEYEDAFRTFPPEAIALDPNAVAPAMMAMGAGRRGRMFRPRRGRERRRDGGGGGDGRDPLELVRRALGMEGMEALDPDSPLLQLYLQSLMPWAQVEGVRPPRG